MRCVFFISALFACFLLGAQNAKIKGVVVDSSTKEVLPGVCLLVEEVNRITCTNALGQFELADISPGHCRIKIIHLGFETQTIEMNLGVGVTNEVSVLMKAMPIQLKEVTVSQKGNIGDALSVMNQLDKRLRPTNSAQDLLRLVPGLFIAQHAGGGKAEQIFLRGFDSDHGTDFFVSIDGIPVNMVSHAHGQGYADFHFVIPETIDQLKAYKGPYAAKFGNFATSGAGEFTTKNAISKNLIKLEYGQFDTYRAVAVIDVLGGKHLFSKQKENAYLAAEYNFTNAYFKAPQHFQRINVFGKYSGYLNQKNFLSFSASTFISNWNASGQIPDRAVKEKMIDRFGSIDNSEGGSTDRSNANLSLISSLKNSGVLRNQIYYSKYHFNLYSNFTFFLYDSINGDEICQTEKGRDIFGYNGTYERKVNIGKMSFKTVAGLGTRIDQGVIALRHAVRRVILDTIVLGKISEQNISTYLDETIQLSPKFSLNAALRADYFFFGFKNYLGDSLNGMSSKSKLSPKLNLYYDVSSSVQFFAHAGFGFHSNDARSVVLGLAENSLPRALGYETGSTFKIGKKILVNAALWGLDLENELVYVGDEGIVEINGATKRLGADVSVRTELSKILFVDFDMNYSRARFVDLPEGENFVPLAPSLTSSGGITLKQEKGFNAGLRYRYIHSRPANEKNTVEAKGYFLLDAVLNYTQSRYQIAVSIENLLNSEWNQAQFDTKSKLKNETKPVSELHYTPGTPFFVKGTISYAF